MGTIDRFLAAAQAAGCPPDQVRRFKIAGYVPQPKQLAFHALARQCDGPDGSITSSWIPNQIGLGGARGGGKSHGILMQVAADDCQRRGGLKVLLLRKVGKAVRESLEDLRLRALFALPHKYNRVEGVLTFPNESRIFLGHFKNESDIDAYLGLEYDVIAVEEATTLTLSKYRAIRTCARTSKPDWRPRVYNTTNPGGVGHAWYKRLFVEPFEAGREEQTRFVPATVDDNRFVDTGYVHTLDGLTGWRRRAWRYGDWDIAAGQFFTTWRRDVHVVPTRRVPRDWRVWCAMDYGFVHWNVVYLLAEDGDGSTYVVDEHAARGWLVPRHAEAIRAMLERNGFHLSDLWTFAAGGDVFARSGKAEQSIAQQYETEGIELSRANADRINGAARVLELLGDVEAGIAPRLYVFDRCARLIECLPQLQHDPHRPEDVLKWDADADEDGVGGDDPYDALRYGLMETAESARAYVFEY
jgi:phage terminase large subunit